MNDNNLANYPGIYVKLAVNSNLEHLAVKSLSFLVIKKKDSIRSVDFYGFAELQLEDKNQCKISVSCLLLFAISIRMNKSCFLESEREQRSKREGNLHFVSREYKRIIYINSLVFGLKTYKYWMKDRYMI